MANTTTTERCFACGRKLGTKPQMADTRDDQIVAVGVECHKLIVKAGEKGYQPPQGGPRLYTVDFNSEAWKTHLSRVS